MTAPQPPEMAALLQTLQTTVSELSRTVTELRRTVEGDQAVGASSIRQTLRENQEENRKQLAELKAQFTAFEQDREVRDARLEGQNNMIKWLGGGSAVTALGVIAALMKLFGGA